MGTDMAPPGPPTIPPRPSPINSAGEAPPMVNGVVGDDGIPAKPYWELRETATRGRPRFRVIGRYRFDESMFIRAALKSLGWVEVTPNNPVPPLPAGCPPRKPPSRAFAKEWQNDEDATPEPPPTVVPLHPRPCENADPVSRRNGVGMSKGMNQETETYENGNTIITASAAGGRIASSENAPGKVKNPPPPGRRLRRPPVDPRVQNKSLESVHWDLTWSSRFSVAQFERMSPWQKVNFLPGIQDICKKDCLHRLIMKKRQFAKTRGEQNKWDFWPAGFNLEDEDQFQAFRNIFADTDSLCTGNTPIFIIKLPGSACGRGVHLVSNLAGVDALKMEESSCHPLHQKKPLAQRYIADVALLDGFKFTLRIYVAVTGVDPLRVYVYKTGLVRMCSKRYDTSDLSDVFVHVDSIDINGRRQDKFAENVTSTLKHEGLRVDFCYALDLLQEQGIDRERLWEDIKVICTQAVLAGEGRLTSVVTRHVKQRSHGFECLGFDVLVDRSGKPWLLEINHTPSLAPHTELENKVKLEMLRDLFLLADANGAGKKKCQKMLHDTLPALACIQRRQHEEGVCEGEFDMREITRQDLWTIIDVELEHERRQQWERAFPSVSSSDLVEYTLPNRDRLLMRWILAGASLARMVTQHEDSGQEEEQRDEQEMLNAD